MSDYIIKMDLDKINPNPLNKTIYGVNKKQHEELKKSIELVGLLEPLTITKDNTLVSGHRRLKAIKEIGWEDVDVRLREFDNINIALVELNRTRIKTKSELLNEAELLKKEYSKMVKKGRPTNGSTHKGRNWTILNVAESLGTSTTTLKKLMSIKSYQPELLEKIDMGLISVGKAYKIVRENHILQGKGGRPTTKSFRTEYRELLKKYKPSLEDLVEEMNISKALSIVGSQSDMRLMGPFGDREPHDFYPTPSKVIQDLLDRESFDGNIWEPACGKGHISKELIKNGYDVISTDLIDRGYGKGKVDFLDDKKIEEFGVQDNIITNPPFKYSLQFVNQSKKVSRKKIAMLGKTIFLEGVERYEMFQDKEFPLKTIYQFSKRPTLIKEGLESTEHLRGMIAYAWFVWERGYVGEPTIKWIK